MDKTKKRQFKKYASWIATVLAVALLAAMPLLAGSEAVEEGPQASILTGTVENRTLEQHIHGGGILSSPDRSEVNLPTGVKILEFLVANGEYVDEGTPLVRVDRISLMSTITSVQETMDHLLSRMKEAAETEVTGELTSQAGGRVKQVFAKEGEPVSDVMLRDGALAVLSLDGLMAVQLEVESNLTAGTEVEILISDGTPTPGRVESNLDGILTVTVEDQGYPVDETVTVSADGSPIGEGRLYVHAPWRAVAYSGIIDRVRITAGDELEPEDVLFELTGVANTGQRDALARQYGQYQELMLRLFRMYQSETIDAPCAGTVSGIEKNSIHLLSGGSGYTVEFLVNAPNGDDETFYLNFAGIVTGINSGNWNLSMDMTPLTVTDYRDLSGLVLDPAKMTQPVAIPPAMPVYQLTDGQWEQIDPMTVLPGDYLLLALDTGGSIVWAVRITEENRNPLPPAQTEPSLPPADPDLPPEPTYPVIPPVTEPTAPAVPTDPTDPSAPSEPVTDPTLPTFPTFPDISYPDIQIPEDFWGSIGGFGGFGDYGSYGGMTPEEPEFDLYDLEGNTLMTITAQDTMILTIAIDEQDISKITAGQKAQVRVEALRDQLFPALVSSIGRSGTNGGGSSKFSVELTLPWDASILPGMSATASIPLSPLENVPTIPLAAVVEQGAKTFLYTGYDEANGEFTGAVEISLGYSDGVYAQLLSGLEPGDTFWYEYYDILELSTEVDSQRSPFG